MIGCLVNAFAVVASDNLHLRYVVDRCVEHLDIECLDEAGWRRWVPFEVVGYAAGLWNPDHYRKARRPGLESLDFESEIPKAVALFDDPSGQVAGRTDAITAAADDSGRNRPPVVAPRAATGTRASRPAIGR